MSNYFACLKPVESLKEYVSDIWIQKADPLDTINIFSPTRVLPNGNIELTFVVGCPIMEVCAKESFVLPMCTLNGQKTVFKDYAATGEVKTIIFRLYPWALTAFSKAPASDFTDKNINFNEVFKSSRVIQLQEELLVCGSIQMCVRVIENFLLENLCQNMIPRYIRDTMKLIYKYNGALPPHEIAERIETGERNMELYFKRFVGVSVKKFSTIIRFQMALKNSGLANENYFFPYYDQAHFIHETQRFTGLSPEQLKNLESKSILDSRFNKNSELYNTVYIQSPKIK
ncbi:MAG: hypothetical protein PQJ46_00055 [Spirochaetales bacterium]|nr:hypothetical protein [Spirochaetales bacterium]